MKINIDKTFEAIFLVIVFSTLLWIGLGNLWDHKISHPMPLGTLASDNYLHLHYSEYLLQTKNMRYTSAAASSGFSDVIWHYAVILSPLGAILAKFSGLASYDAVILIVYLFSILGATVIYFTIKEFNRKIAILSIPLSIFLFSGNFYFIFLWGQYQMLVSSFFVFLSVWSISKLHLKGMYILLGVFISASFHAHQSETLVLIVFIIVYAIIKLIIERGIFPEFIELIKATIVFVIISFYNILLFKYAYLDQFANQPLLDFSNPSIEYLRTVNLSSFGFVSILLVVGTIASFFYIKKVNMAVLYGLFMLVWGYLNYLGGTIGNKSIPQRFVWPITLSVFLGIILYFLFKLLRLNLKQAYFFGISLIIMFLFSMFYYKDMGSGSLINQYQWDSLMWLKYNSEANSNVLFFYGDQYNQQGILYNSLKHSYLVKQNDYISGLKDNILKRIYLVTDVGEYNWRYPYMRGFLSFSSHSSEINISRSEDMCGFDYIHLDIQSYYPEFKAYNNKAAIALIKSGFTKSFDNGFSIVLKNPKEDKDCMPAYINLSIKA